MMLRFLEAKEADFCDPGVIRVVIKSDSIFRRDPELQRELDEWVLACEGEPFTACATGRDAGHEVALAGTNDRLPLESMPTGEEIASSDSQDRDHPMMIGDRI